MVGKWTALLAATSLLGLASCDETTTEGPKDSGSSNPTADAGVQDAGGAPDAGHGDLGGGTDAAATDGGATDRGATDRGATDSGALDAGAGGDAGVVDASYDAGPIRVIDAGPLTRPEELVMCADLSSAPTLTARNDLLLGKLNNYDTRGNRVVVSRGSMIELIADDGSALTTLDAQRAPVDEWVLAWVADDDAIVITQDASFWRASIAGDTIGAWTPLPQSTPELAPAGSTDGTFEFAGGRVVATVHGVTRYASYDGASIGPATDLGGPVSRFWLRGDDLFGYGETTFYYARLSDPTPVLGEIAIDVSPLWPIMAGALGATTFWLGTHNDIHAVDVTDPAAPSLLASYTTIHDVSVCAYSLAELDGVLLTFAGPWGSSLKLDVTNPLAPTLIAHKFVDAPYWVEPAQGGFFHIDGSMWRTAIDDTATWPEPEQVWAGSASTTTLWRLGDRIASSFRAGSWVEHEPTTFLREYIDDLTAGAHRPTTTNSTPIAFQGNVIVRATNDGVRWAYSVGWNDSGLCFLAGWRQDGSLTAELSGYRDYDAVSLRFPSALERDDAQDIAQFGDRFYAVSERGSSGDYPTHLVSLRWDDPANPAPHYDSHIEIEREYSAGLAATDGWVYVGTRTDVSAFPDVPGVGVGRSTSIPLGGQMAQLKAVGDRLYYRVQVGWLTWSFGWLDISDPSTPTSRRDLGQPEDATIWRFSFDDAGHALAGVRYTDRTVELWMIDTAAADAPCVLARTTVPTISYPLNIFALDDVILVGVYEQGIAVIDVSPP